MSTFTSAPIATSGAIGYIGQSVKLHTDTDSNDNYITLQSATCPADGVLWPTVVYRMGITSDAAVTPTQPASFTVERLDRYGNSYFPAPAGSPLLLDGTTGRLRCPAQGVALPDSAGDTIPVILTAAGGNLLVNGFPITTGGGWVGYALGTLNMNVFGIINDAGTKLSADGSVRIGGDYPVDLVGTSLGPSANGNLMLTTDWTADVRAGNFALTRLRTIGFQAADGTLHSLQVDASDTTKLLYDGLPINDQWFPTALSNLDMNRHTIEHVAFMDLINPATLVTGRLSMDSTSAGQLLWNSARLAHYALTEDIAAGGYSVRNADILEGNQVHLNGPGSTSAALECLGAGSMGIDGRSIACTPAREDLVMGAADASSLFGITHAGYIGISPGPTSTDPSADCLLSCTPDHLTLLVNGVPVGASWVGVATSDLRMAGYSINNVDTFTSAGDVHMKAKLYNTFDLSSLWDVHMIYGGPVGFERVPIFTNDGDTHLVGRVTCDDRITLGENIDVAGDMSVVGDSVFTGGASFATTVDISGALGAASGNITDLVTSSLIVSTSFLAYGGELHAIGVYDAATFNCIVDIAAPYALNVNGLATVNDLVTLGNITVGGTSTITGDAACDASLTVLGESFLGILNSTGNTTLGTSGTASIVLRSPASADYGFSAQGEVTSDSYMRAAEVRLGISSAFLSLTANTDYTQLLVNGSPIGGGGGGWVGTATSDLDMASYVVKWPSAVYLGGFNTIAHGTTYLPWSPSTISDAIFVYGDIVASEGAVFAGNLTADGDLTIGNHALVTGNVTASGDLYGTYIHANRDVIATRNLYFGGSLVANGVPYQSNLVDLNGGSIYNHTPRVEVVATPSNPGLNNAHSGTTFFFTCDTHAVAQYCTIPPRGNISYGWEVVVVNVPGNVTSGETPPWVDHPLEVWFTYNFAGYPPPYVLSIPVGASARIRCVGADPGDYTTWLFTVQMIGGGADPTVACMPLA